MVPCGVCAVGEACAGPNEPLTVDGNHPDAFTCVPGCAGGGPPDEAQIVAPECGEPLPGTVGLASCPLCPGTGVCYDGTCQTQCAASGLTIEGRCVAGEAQWCEADLPQATDCAAEGSDCCTGADAQNQVGYAACCSCALECEAKEWECGTNTCGEGCGLPETVDGCPTGYDCQGHACVCTIPELCEDHPARREAAEPSKGGNVFSFGGGVERAVEQGEQDPLTGSSGCGECRAANAPPGAGAGGVLLAWLMLALALAARKPSEQDGPL